MEGTAQPWGRLAGVLAVCGSTLLGIARQLDPDVIVVRSLVAGLVVGLVATVMARLLTGMARDE